MARRYRRQYLISGSDLRKAVYKLRPAQIYLRWLRSAEGMRMRLIVPIKVIFELRYAIQHGSPMRSVDIACPGFCQPHAAVIRV